MYVKRGLRIEIKLIRVWKYIKNYSTESISYVIYGFKQFLNLSVLQALLQFQFFYSQPFYCHTIKIIECLVSCCLQVWMHAVCTVRSMYVVR